MRIVRLVTLLLLPSAAIAQNGPVQTIDIYVNYNSFAPIGASQSDIQRVIQLAGHQWLSAGANRRDFRVAGATTAVACHPTQNVLVGVLGGKPGSPGVIAETSACTGTSIIKYYLKSPTGIPAGGFTFSVWPQDDTVTDLQMVTTHELGHILGMTHVNETEHCNFDSATYGPGVPQRGFCESEVRNRCTAPVFSHA